MSNEGCNFGIRRTVWFVLLALPLHESKCPRPPLNQRFLDVSLTSMGQICHSPHSNHGRNSRTFQSTGIVFALRRPIRRFRSPKFVAKVRLKSRRTPDFAHCWTNQVSKWMRLWYTMCPFGVLLPALTLNWSMDYVMAKSMMSRDASHVKIRGHSFLLMFVPPVVVVYLFTDDHQPTCFTFRCFSVLENQSTVILSSECLRRSKGNRCMRLTLTESALTLDQNQRDTWALFTKTSFCGRGRVFILIKVNAITEVSYARNGMYRPVKRPFCLWLLPRHRCRLLLKLICTWVYGEVFRALYSPWFSISHGIAPCFWTIRWNKGGLESGEHYDPLLPRLTGFAVQC